MNTTAAAAVLSAALALTAVPAAAAESGMFTCHVVRAVDGDTLECADGRRVRLWGVDAPEIDTRRGKLAKDFLFLVAVGTDLVCEEKGESYGRTVARCAVDLGAALVAAGLARDCPRYSGGFYERWELDRDLPRRRSCEVPR